MAKNKYKVATKYGTVTRSTDRVYTHVVVGGRMKESAFIKNVFAWADTAPGCKAMVDNPDLMAKDMAERLPLGLMGFCGSLPLARKLTVGWKAEDLEEVLIYDLQTGKIV